MRHVGLGVRVKSLVKDLEGIFVVMEDILWEFRVWVLEFRSLGGLQRFLLSSNMEYEGNWKVRAI